MDRATQTVLNNLNARFYRAQAASFSATRQAPWEGWKRSLQAAAQVGAFDRRAHDALAETASFTAGGRAVKDTGRSPAPAAHADEKDLFGTGGRPLAAGAAPQPLSVLDLACGNLRYARFLDTALPERPLAYYGVDSADDLAFAGVHDGASAAGPHAAACAENRRDAARAEDHGGGERVEDLRAAADAGNCCGPAGRGASRPPKESHRPQKGNAAETRPASSPSAGAEHVAVRYQHLDIVGALIAGKSLARCIAAPACDLTACFGFLHHVPGAEARMAVLDALIEKTRPGGCVVVSLWQFMDDERLARKARAATAAGLAELAAQGALPALGENDYLLGWQDTPGAYRYCHHFTPAEAEALAIHARHAYGCRLVERFNADGKTHALNAYLVFQRPFQRP